MTTLTILSPSEIRRRIKTHYSDEFIKRVVDINRDYAGADQVLSWIQGHIASSGSYSEERKNVYLPLLRKWTKTSNGLLIEIGCGLGQGSVVYASAGYDVVSVDMTAISVRTARMRAHEDGVLCQFVVADAHKLPFKDGMFDICMCIEVIEHVRQHKETVLCETCRVAKKGGIIEIETPNRLWPKDFHSTQLYLINYFPQRIAEIYAGARRRLFKDGLDRYVTYPFIAKKLAQCQCEIIGDTLGLDFAGFKNMIQDPHYSPKSKLKIIFPAVTRLCKVPGFGAIMKLARVFVPLIIITARKT